MIQITKADDASSNYGHKLAMRSVGRQNSHLWATLPTDGGCPWYYNNVNKPGGFSQRRKDRNNFLNIWKKFVVVSDFCLTQGGHVTLIMPKECMFWKRRSVDQFVVNNQMHIGEFASGLVVAMPDSYASTKTFKTCLLYTSPSPRDGLLSRMPSSA